MKTSAIDENGQEYVVMERGQTGHFTQVLFARNYREENGIPIVDIPLVKLTSDGTYIPVFFEGQPFVEENLVKVSIAGKFVKVPVRE